MNIGLLILRLVVGIPFIAHGGQKLFGWFGGPGIAGTAPFLDQMGFRPGRLHAYLVGLAEVGGGLLLAAGLLTPLSAALLISVMSVAVVSVHLRSGFFIQNNGYEYTLVLAGSALAAAFTGPGAISLDRLLGISWAGELWGVSALVLGLVSAAAALLARSIGSRTAASPATDN